VNFFVLNEHLHKSCYFIYDHSIHEFGQTGKKKFSINIRTISQKVLQTLHNFLRIPTVHEREAIEFIEEQSEHFLPSVTPP
jgi:hypothetical protein